MGERLASETFIGRLREELLERELFVNLKEAKVLLEDYRKHYNHKRPHGALGYLTPDEFAAIEALTSQGLAPQNSYNPYKGSHYECYRERVPVMSKLVLRMRTGASG